MIRNLKNPIFVAIVTGVLLVVFAVGIGRVATNNLRAAEYRDCTQRNSIIDQQNKQGQGITIILQQTKTYIQTSPTPLPAGVTKEQILAEYQQLIDAEAPLPHFNCDVFK